MTKCLNCYEQVRGDGRTFRHVHTNDPLCWTGDGSTATPGPNARVASLAVLFAHTDPGVGLWLEYPSTDRLDGHDCTEMATRFADFLNKHGVPAEVVELGVPADNPVPWVGEHFVTVVDGIAYDWTARQWYNLPVEQEDWLDPDTISTPLVYPIAEPYPLDGVPLTPVSKEEDTMTGFYWTGWEDETDLGNEDDREGVQYLTINDASGSEVAIIVHRQWFDARDEAVKATKEAMAQRIVDALNAATSDR